MVKNLPANGGDARDLSSIPGSPTLQADSLPTELQGEGPIVNGVAESGTRLK